MHQDKYQRLLDLIVLPETPCSLYATHSCFNYKNIFIPSLDVQRLCSLDNQLVVIGPEMHGDESPETSYHESRNDWSRHTMGSSIIETCDIGGLPIAMLSQDDLIDSELAMVHIREKHVAGNLDYISEEVEPSLQPSLTDAALPSTTFDNNFFSVVDESLQEIADESLEKTQAANINNNSERNVKAKKDSRVSKLSLANTRRADSLAFPPGRDDVVSQILATTGPAAHSSGMRRHSSTFDPSHRASNVGASHSTSIFNHAKRYSKSVHGKKTAGKASVMNALTTESYGLSKIESVDSKSAMRKSQLGVISQHASTFSVDDNSFKIQLSAASKGQVSDSSRFSSKKLLDTDRSRKLDTLGKAADADGLALPGSSRSESKEDVHNSQKSDALHPKDESSASVWVPDDSTQSSSISRADSDESVDLRTFQAALKKDYLPGMTMLDREKTVLHSVLGQRKQSILEEGNRTEYLDSAEVKNDPSDSVSTRHSFRIVKSARPSQEYETRLFNHSSHFPLRDIVTNRAKSYDHVAAYPMTNKVRKHGSQMSMIDVSMNTNKARAMSEIPFSRRRSAVTTDPKLHDGNESLFAAADRIEQSKVHDQQVPTALQENRFLNMQISAADGAAGPLKSTKTTSLARMRVSSLDNKIDHLNLPSHRLSAGPSLTRRPSWRSEGISTVLSCDIEAQRCNIGVQASFPCTHDRFFEKVTPMRTSYDNQSHSRVPLHRESAYEGASSSITRLRFLSNQTDPIPSSLKAKSSSSQSRKQVKPATSVTPPTESLLPLLSPVSGTVLQSLAAVTSSIAISRKLLAGQCKIDGDSRNIVHCNSPDSRGHKMKGLWCDVKSINTNNGEFELFEWREMTVRLCKYTADSHCLPLDIDSMLYSSY